MTRRATTAEKARRRAVPEWIGANPDTPIPARVRLRVFDRYDGICHWSTRKINAGDVWHVDHVKAICNGGENREGNLAPILAGNVHAKKTYEDVQEKARSDSIRMKHLGIKKTPSRPVPGSIASGWYKPVNGPARRREE